MKEKFLLKELSRYKIGTYADIVYRNALLYKDREAFVYGSQRVTFSQYNKRVNRTIHGLQSMGLRKGDGIGILSWNCLEYTYLYGAAMKGGFIISPFNPRLQTAELEHIINYSEVKALFVGPELTATIDQLRSRLPGVTRYISLGEPFSAMVDYDTLLQTFPESEPDVFIEEDDPFVIFYTSGTTGVPRGALYNHGRSVEDHKANALHLRIGPDHKHVMIMPLFHIGGSSHFWSFFCVGASNVIMTQRSYDPAATLQTIQDEKATDIHIVPTHLVGMLGLPTNDYNLKSLTQILYAASPMPVELLRKGIDRFGPIFTQHYGQSESGPHVTFLQTGYHEVLNKSPEEQAVLGSCGHPFIGVHVRIVDGEGRDKEARRIGEIVVQSKWMMTGYWHKPEYTRETIVDGWLHTGDMGYYDENGFIYIVDRKKDMIISGGENIYPREVEEVLYRHPAVLEAVSIGVPDPVWVERVHALIVLKKGCQATGDEIIEFCKNHLARYKAPKTVEFVDSLPKTPSGKILKRELRGKYREGK